MSEIDLDYKQYGVGQGTETWKYAKYNFTEGIKTMCHVNPAYVLIGTIHIDSR